MMNAYVRDNGRIDVMTDTQDLPMLSTVGLIMVAVTRYANRANRFECNSGNVPYFEFPRTTDFEEPKKC